MSIVVPFDGSRLSGAALVRATQIRAVFGGSIVAVTVIPEGNRKYARERGWLESTEAYDTDTIVARIHQQAVELAPAADYSHALVDRYAQTGSIATRLREIAKEADASLVIVGSENAGRIVSGLNSVGGKVTQDTAYDVLIVRTPLPAEIEEISELSHYDIGKSDFYIPEKHR